MGNNVDRWFGGRVNRLFTDLNKVLDLGISFEELMKAIPVQYSGRRR